MPTSNIVSILKKQSTKNLEKLEKNLTRLNQDMQSILQEISQTKSYIELYKKSIGEEPQVIATTSNIRPSNNTIFAMDLETVEMMKELPAEFFTVSDINTIAGRKEKDIVNVWNFIAAWKQRGWITTVTNGKYKKTEKFGIK